MKLQRLIIQGFKSFKDKTVIHFDDGITGIVGPNGCGKSNIVDALFWVMGEQSAKHLRGTKMQDLIFSGSSKYNPSAWAEVSLVLVNEEGKHIHIGQKLAKPSEIQITRKLYRNGETEYRINNYPCRLKDIHEVFMDTGAGAKSYSIIAQGEINRLVQAKPVERRTMIEEVAGITKFKLRRRESMKKIENTQLNLDRLSDLQTEIYKQLKKLETQAEKAQRAKNLREKVKRHELIVTSHKEHELLTSFRDLKVGTLEAAEELEELKLKKNALEISLEDERIQRDEMLEALNGRQAEFNEKSKELAASQERLNYFEKDQIEKEKLRERTQNEIEEIQDYLETRRERLVEVEEELTALEQESTDGVDVEELQNTVEALSETKEGLEQNVRELEERLNELKSERSELERELATIEAQTSEYSRSLESMTIEAEELEKETSSHHDSLSSEREKVNSLESNRDKLKARMTELQEEHAQLKMNNHSLEDELSGLRKEHIQSSSKLDSLKAVSESLGEDENFKKFFENFNNGEIAKLGELIETPAEYGQCIDALLGEWLGLVVENDQAVKSWLKENNETKVNIVKESTTQAVSTETINRLEVLGATGVKAVSEIVNLTQNEWTSTVQNFLEGFYVVENLDHDLMDDISSSVNFKGLVSSDGRFVLAKSHGLVIKKFKGTQKGMGVVERNNLIRELSEKVESLEEQIEAKETQYNELNELFVNTTNDLEVVREEYNQVNSKYQGLKSALEAKESFAGNNSSKLERIKERKKEFSIKRLELVEKEEKLLERKNEVMETLEELTSRLEEEKEELTQATNNFQDKREEFVAIKLKIDSFDSRRQNIVSSQNDVKAEIERYAEKLESQKERLDQLQTEYTTILETIDELKESNSEQAELLSTEETALLEQKDSVDELLSQMQDREEEVKTINSRVTQLEKETAVAATRTEQIISEEELLVRDVFERYQVDLRDVITTSIKLDVDIEQMLADVSNLFVMETEEGECEIAKNAYEFEKRFPGQVKESKDKFRRYKTDLNRLGEINWQAVEDYDKQKLRHEFLKSQEEELKASLNDLQIAIDHIDQKSRIRFKEAYDEVNMRFQKVFPIIFGGGSATLKLIGDMDDPECGIDIIAQPPGKKMQNINLMSGGEKAMTAVSLIFSIFLVKPSPFCLLDEVDAPLDDANVGRFNELLREMSSESQFILITHNKKTMELNDMLYGVTMQEPGISKAISVQLH